MWIHLDTLHGYYLNLAKTTCIFTFPFLSQNYMYFHIPISFLAFCTCRLTITTINIDTPGNDNIKKPAVLLQEELILLKETY